MALLGTRVGSKMSGVSSDWLDKGPILEFRCLVTNGLGQASYNLSQQIPAINAFFRDSKQCLDDCGFLGAYHCGTINVIPEINLSVTRPHLNTPPILWRTRGGKAVEEAFSFVRVEVEWWHTKQQETDGEEGWLYLPQLSPNWRKNHHEILLPEFIKDFSEVMTLRINLSRIDKSLL